MIYIFYLKNKKIMKIIKFDDKKMCIEIIKFSNNSGYLLVGANDGCLYCFDINNNFKIIYNQNVHQNTISGILDLGDD